MAKKEFHKKHAEKPLNRGLLGPCGMYCGYCLVYRQGKCEGCIAMSKKKEEEGEVFCGIYACSSKKGLAACMDCDTFPCNRYEPGMDSIFSDKFVKFVRETTGRE